MKDVYKVYALLEHYAGTHIEDAVKSTMEYREACKFDEIYFLFNEQLIRVDKESTVDSIIEKYHEKYDEVLS